MTPYRLAASILAAAILLAACASAGQTTAPPTPSQAVSTAPAPAHSAAPRPPQGPALPGTLRAVHDPGEVTGTLAGACHFQGGGQLPDPGCTPGAIDPAVTQANIGRTICVAGYTRTVRPPESQTERFKFDEAYPAYGVPDGTKTELDHLVSLELGGANDASNLWPEVPPTPNPKDTVENALHDAVCSGRVTLAAAQQAIASDWETAEAGLGLG